jgi:rhodanese-related sulfurtransferase
MIENLTPREAWDFLQRNKNAVLVDVRTKVEHDFVGHPLAATHIAWKEAPDWQVNRDFVTEVEKLMPDKKTPVLLLCRSGQRSLDAAGALERAGFSRLINIVEGFEGPLDQHHHRGNIAGWRFNGLPWAQS